MNISTESLAVLRRLRLPSARPALLLFPYTPEGAANSGITVELAAGEPAVAAGAGTVEDVYTALPQFQTTDPSLRSSAAGHVLIDHGGQIKTLVGGLENTVVHKGQTVLRGDRLGDLKGSQLFFSASVGRKTVNPLTISRHWLPQNGNIVTGQGGHIRFAPDRIVRDLSNGISVTLTNGVKYFRQALTPAPFLVNVDFNGGGTKTGPAATGVTDADHWNVYTPVDFTAAASATCYYGTGSSYGYWFGYGYGYGYGVIDFKTFTSDPVLCLAGYDGLPSNVLLERIAPLFSASGSGACWDSMLATWIGGYIGPVPYENTFRIRNIPSGSYDLFLYANQGALPEASTFYAATGTGLPTAKGNSPTVSSVFVEDGNYVKFQLTVPAGGYITFKAVGYLSGMQLQRA